MGTVKVRTPWTSRLAKGRRSFLDVVDVDGRGVAKFGMSLKTRPAEDVAYAQLCADAPDLLMLLRVALRSDICPYCGSDNVVSGECRNEDCAGVILAKRLENIEIE